LEEKATAKWRRRRRGDKEAADLDREEADPIRATT
jgi:hypothetical protein